MKAKQKNVAIWIVVFVFRGLIDKAVVFRNRQAAMACARRLRSDLNRDYDELEVFQRTVRRRS